jgi:hypothetical protein
MGEGDKQGAVIIAEDVVNTHWLVASVINVRDQIGVEAMSL